MNQNGENPSGWRIGAVTDNLIFLVGYGSWGKPEALKFFEEYRTVVAGFGNNPWAVMADATEWGIGDGAVQEMFRDHERWIVEHGCRVACFYSGPGALNRLLLYRLAEPDSDDYQFRVYPYRGKAVEALDSGGFSVSEEQLNSFFRGDGQRD